MTVVYKCGVWDLLHVGHLNVIHIAASLGDKLVIGVATDEYVLEYKGRLPTIPFHDRARLVSEIRCVDAVIPYSAVDDMTPIELFGVDVIVVDEQYGRGDSEHSIKQKRARRKFERKGITLVEIPRTPGVSSTKIKESVYV